jgi:hypothetical protein
MDQRTAGSPVAIVEGVDGLELRVHERRLYERLQGIPVHRIAEVVKQRVHFLRRRRHVVRAARIPAAPRPVSSLASARASCRTSTCNPSTFDDAIDSVRRRSRARGASAGPALELSSWIAASESEMKPAASPSRTIL